MSFIDNEKTVGIAFLIVGVLLVLSALVSIVQLILADAANMGTIISLVGSIVGGAIYAMLGLKVNNGLLSGKLNILGNYIRTVGVVTIVTGIISAIGAAVDGGFGSAILSAIVSIILGLIILWVANKMLDGKDSIADRIIWIILVLVFALLFLIGLFAIFGALVLLSLTLLITCICETIIYLFMLMYLLDYDVKKSMGMVS